MNTITLQVPVSRIIKSHALATARDYGFSSLQEILRVILTKLAKRQLMVTIEEAPSRLSRKSEKRYDKIYKDVKRGKKSKSFSSVSSLMRDLRS